MAVQEIHSHSYRDVFKVDQVSFEKACVMNSSRLIDSYQIYWMKDGKGKYNIDFKLYEVQGNVLFFLSPGQVFSVESEEIKEGYRISFVQDFYCISTHDKEISCNGVLFNNLNDSPYVNPSEHDSAKLTFILENLLEEMAVQDTAQFDMLQSYLKQFIIQTVRIKNDLNPLSDSISSKLYKDFNVLLDQNYGKIHAVSDYAARLGVSPKTLSKHFQKLDKSTPSELIKNRILLEAKRRLTYSDQNVKQIAFDLGFNDPAYFSRFFTKTTGISPLKFKKGA